MGRIYDVIRFVLVAILVWRSVRARFVPLMAMLRLFIAGAVAVAIWHNLPATAFAVGVALVAIFIRSRFARRDAATERQVEPLGYPLFALFFFDSFALVLYLAGTVLVMHD
jgi:Kef-type K+ transport system membrane component KefB